MNKLLRWKWLVLTVALIALPFTAPTQAAGVSTSQGSSASMSQAELEQMLAPIALYPDTLLTHILIASTYPLEVVQAQRYLEDNPNLSVDQVMSRTEDKDWDPSVKALMGFPTVLEKMGDNLDWTQNLGEAFLADEGQVMDAIQSLRQQADKADNLSDMDNVAVTRANNQIIIEPARPEVIYVPYYDPRVVYGPWRWGVAYPPVYWDFGHYYSHRPGVSIYWSPGINISFNFFFSSFRWHDHRVVVIDHHHSHRYRPLNRYSASYGAQPWKHKPEHRRGVVYHNPVVKQRYPSHGKFSPRDAHSNGGPRHNSQYAKPKDQHDPRHNLGNKGIGNDKGSHSYSRDRDHAPNFKNTQAALKERRDAQTNHALPNRDNKAQLTRDNKDQGRVDNARPDNKASQPQLKNSREQPRDNAQRHVQPRTQEIRAQQPPKQVSPRPEVKRAEPQRMEHRQIAPRQQEQRQPVQKHQETRVRQEPRQQIQAARGGEHRSSRPAQGQVRHHRE
ncbi:DUF3300 domain-containing protein [Shewanella acanthi]|uniref:DUF3300 domain-containing protein n=1 Tax=Shewanella acanthi TaxID=2864212 RepID=UPI001C656604|nr:DUF3300 domain-containing protein [Shewanella acanthi]QYJ78724.1 DUF3300 domain-containing protein [Shewanella acanthi]